MAATLEEQVADLQNRVAVLEEIVKKENVGRQVIITRYSNGGMECSAGDVCAAPYRACPENDRMGPVGMSSSTDKVLSTVPMTCTRFESQR